MGRDVEGDCLGDVRNEGGREGVGERWAVRVPGVIGWVGVVVGWRIGGVVGGQTGDIVG